MSPLNTLAPEASEIAMLCGAPSWLSKAMVNGLPALTVTAGVVNVRSLATTVTVSPDGLPAGTALALAAVDVPEQAASRATRTIKPRVRVRRFTSEDSLDRYARWAQAPAAAVPRPLTSLRNEASSRRTSATGLPSWRANSTARVTIRATSMVLAM